MDKPIDHAEIVCPSDTRMTCRMDIIQGNYDAKWKIARKYKPERILEIGVRCGYGAHALICGSGQVKTYLGIDNDDQAHEGGPWLWWAEKLLAGLDVDWRILEQDSHSVQLEATYDLAHVDGDHTYSGCMSDMTLAWDALVPGGVMIVDDATYLPGPRAACAKWGADVDDIAETYLEESPAGSMVYVKA